MLYQRCERTTSSRLNKVLNDAGFTNLSKIDDTLQGSVWRATSSTQSNVVIKATSKYLYQNSMAVAKGKTYHNIAENILLEASILNYLTQQQNIPQSITKYCDFLESDSDYFLVMQDGGTSLFQFINKAHQLIAHGNLSIAEWHKAVKEIFKQMVEIIDYIHSKRICHNDISLENFLINDVIIECLPITNKIRFDTDSLQIKLCDFGLAHFFKDDETFLTNKFVGKNVYKSPENMQKAQHFNAKKNDIWCLGVCLFMMVFGSAPWQQAHKTDKLFEFVMNGYLSQILISWKKDDYVTSEMMDLFQSFFQYEEKRIEIEGIKQNVWFLCK